MQAREAVPDLMLEAQAVEALMVLVLAAGALILGLGLLVLLGRVERRDDRVQQALRDHKDHKDRPVSRAEAEERLLEKTTTRVMEITPASQTQTTPERGTPREGTSK